MVWIDRVAGKVPVAIAIAGSDSSGGAGIQADLKTFAALGVHGTTAITCITAQNTSSVTGVEDLPVDMIEKQITAVMDDLKINAGKTGMLHTKEIVDAVSSQVRQHRFPLVVDPVMVSKSGAPLLRSDAIDSVIDSLLPLATVVTPNKFEAERLAEINIRTIQDAKDSARKISQMGPQAVVVKGGHLHEKEAVDILYYRGEFKLFSGPRFDVTTTHGTGCSFSAAIAAELAKGKDIQIAVETAKRFVAFAIRFGLQAGAGHGPVNPLACLYRESSRYIVLMDLEKAKAELESSTAVRSIVPEVGMNVAMAIPYAENIDDVAAIEGRIVKVLEGVRAVGCARFGCSSHLAKYILEANKLGSTARAAINLKFSDEILKALEKKGLKISLYDRREEPQDIKTIEGMTIPWGVNQAVKRIGEIPDVVYHRGDMGKEPMIVILGGKSSELAKLATEIVKETQSLG